MTRTVLAVVSGTAGFFTLVSAAGMFAGVIPVDTFIILIMTFLISLFGWIFVSRGRWRVAGIFSPLVIFIAAVYGNYIGGIDAPAMLLYIIVIMLIGITYGSRFIVPAAAICSAVLLALGFAHHAEIIHPLRTGESAFYNRVTIIMLSIASIAMLIRLIVNRFQHALTESIANSVRILDLAEKNEALLLQARVEIERRTHTEEKLQEKNQELEAANEDLQAAMEELDAGNEELAKSCHDLQDAEEAIRRERDFSNTLIQQSPAFFVAIDPDGRTKMMNRTLLEALGYTGEEVAGLDYLRTFVPREEHALLEEVFKKILIEKKTNININRILARNGREFIVEWYGCPVVREEGSTEYFFGLGIDITERKRTEKIINIQHEMALALGGTDDLDRALSIVMDACLQIEGIDSGGIYLVDHETGGIDLVCSRNLTEEFIIQESHYNRDTPGTLLLMEGSPIYLNYSDILQTRYGFKLNEVRATEGLRSLSVVPIKDRISIIGCINLASHAADRLSENSRRAIESIASQVAGVITRLRIEREVRNSLNEKNMLLKEIHHRVKNNMQVISSLIQLQLDRLRDPSDRELMGGIRTSVRSMALIHEKLYRSQDFSHIDMDGYVREFVSEILRFNPAAERISATIKIGRVSLGIDEAIPCGLIINELITNSLKHAFPGDRTGGIVIELNEREGKRTLRVHDDGIGLPESINHGRPSSLGLQLVSALVNQLDGTMKVERDGGTSYIITF